MPELPEVETVRRTLEQTVLGRVVCDVTVHRRDVIVAPGDPPGGFSRHAGPRPTPKRLRRADLLMNDRILRLERHGKQIAMVGSTDRVIVIHLGMSGQLIYRARGERPASRKHIHVTWKVEDPEPHERGHLVFRDPRRFGGVWVFPTFQSLLEGPWARMGVDALDASIDDLMLASRSRRSIKAVLLDQSVIAGVGNIYADESLHRAKIHPLRTADSLTAREFNNLFRSLQALLREAIERQGSSLRDYVDISGKKGSFQSLHQVYGRRGKPCLGCGRALESGVVAQRTTVWCDSCQPMA